MPDDVSLVGGLTLPVPAATAGDILTDPVAYHLLQLSALAIKEALDPRLLAFLPANTHTDACPAANRFNFDPTSPRGHAVKLPKPSLFVWWEGVSSWSRVTSGRDIRTRTLNVLYVFEELPSQDSMIERHGLMNVVDASLFRLGQRQINFNYENGKTLSELFGDRGAVSWNYNGGQPGRFGIDEGPGAARRAAKKSGRDWPALFASFMVEELVQAPQPGDNGGRSCHNLELEFNMDASAEGDSMDYFTRYVEGWNGCEDED